MERVIRQAQRLKRACAKPDVEWGELSLALKELADAVELLGSDERAKHEAVNDHLVPLADDFGELLKNIRSKLVADTCEQLVRIVKATRHAFTPLATLLLVALANTAKGSSIAIREPGFKLFSDVSEYARYDLHLLQKIYRSSPQERVRVLLLEQMQVVLAYWSKDEIEPNYVDMLDVLRRGMRDPSSQVRTACRNTFCSFSSLWIERLDELVDVPTVPARDLLMKEKPHAAITKAIHDKFFKDAAMQTRPDSASSIRQRRAEFRRQASSALADGEDPIFIEVTESPNKPRRASATLPNRSASPAREPRGVSPARNGRGVSPVPATRGVSPGRQTMVPASRGISPGRQAPTTGLGPASRGVSPSRNLNPTAHATRQVRAPSPGAHGRASSPARVPNDERPRFHFDRIPENNNENLRGVANRGSQEKHHKRVSIIDPKQAGSKQVASPSNDYDGSHGGYHQVTATAKSPSSTAPPTTFSFTPAVPFSFDRQRPPPPQQHDQSQLASELTRPSASINLEHKENNGDALNTLREPDSFLDHPIPSSSATATPRLSTNVTLRERRRPVGSNIPVSEAPVPDVLEKKTSGVNSSSDRFYQQFGEHPSQKPTSGTLIKPRMTSTHPRIKDPRHDPVQQPSTHESDQQLHLTESASDVEETMLVDRLDADEAPLPETRAQINAPIVSDALASLGQVRNQLRDLRQRTGGDHQRNDYEATVESPQSRPPPMGTERPTLMNANLKADNNHHHGERAGLPSTSVIPSTQRSRQTAVASNREDPRTSSPPVRASHPRVQSNDATSRDPTFISANHQANSGPPTAHLAPSSIAHEQAVRQQYEQPARQERAAPSVAAHIPTRPNPMPSRAHVAEPVDETSQIGLDKKKSNHPRIVDDRHVGADAPSRKNASGDERHQRNDPRLEQHLMERPPPKSSSPGSNDRGVSSPEQLTERDSLSREPPSDEHHSKRPVMVHPDPRGSKSRFGGRMLYVFCVVLAALFGASGLIQAASKVRDAYEYHQALLDRINRFETSIVESYESVRKMDEKYALWSEYVRELAEQDESNALHQLESIQHEVEKWQVEMKNDLIEFKRSLSGDIIDAALAPLRENNSTGPTPREVL